MVRTPSVHPGRQAHVGHWLSRAAQRFDARVLSLMARDDQLPLALAHLAGRGSLNASHLHITRHLPVSGARLTELAAWAGISKQAMGRLVDECSVWGLVQRTPDPRDARAKRIAYTEAGLAWVGAMERAVAQAEAELRLAVGAEVATVIVLGLEAYAS